MSEEVPSFRQTSVPSSDRSFVQQGRRARRYWSIAYCYSFRNFLSESFQQELDQKTKKNFELEAKLRELKFRVNELEVRLKSEIELKDNCLSRLAEREEQLRNISSVGVDHLSKRRSEDGYDDHQDGVDDLQFRVLESNLVLYPEDIFLSRIKELEGLLKESTKRTVQVSDPKSEEVILKDQKDIIFWFSTLLENLGESGLSTKATRTVSENFSALKKELEKLCKLKPRETDLASFVEVDIAEQSKPIPNISKSFSNLSQPLLPPAPVASQSAPAFKTPNTSIPDISKHMVSEEIQEMSNEEDDRESNLQSFLKQPEKVNDSRIRVSKLAFSEEEYDD